MKDDLVSHLDFSIYLGIEMEVLAPSEITH